MSSQVAMFVPLKHKSKDAEKEFVLVTTHLKAKEGPKDGKFRNKQVEEICSILSNEYHDLPVILGADLNTAPNGCKQGTNENPIDNCYNTLIEKMNLFSAYAEAKNLGLWKTDPENHGEPMCTTYKAQMRPGNPISTYENDLKKRTIDYILLSKDHFKVHGLLNFPSYEDEDLKLTKLQLRIVDSGDEWKDYQRMENVSKLRDDKKKHLELALWRHLETKNITSTNGEGDVVYKTDLEYKGINKFEYRSVQDVTGFPNLIPSFKYSSDHWALFTEIEFLCQ